MKPIVVAVLLFLSTSSSLASESKELTPTQEEIREAFYLSAAARYAIFEIWKDRGSFPKNRTETGMAQSPENINSGAVGALDVFSGIVVVTFSDEAQEALRGKVIVFEPAIEDGRAIVWRCGVALPAGASDFQPIGANLIPDWCITGVRNAN
ncbi:MAG: pilin [Pseudomonadota bacterium]